MTKVVAPSTTIRTEYMPPRILTSAWSMQNNVPTIVSTEASRLAPLHRRLLLDAVLTTLHNILVEFVNVFWQTQAGSPVSQLCA